MSLLPLSIRLSPETSARLSEAAARLRIKKHTFAQMAVEAAIEAVERQEGRLVLPIAFEVTHEPAAVPPPRPRRLVGRAAAAVVALAPFGEAASALTTFL